MAKEARSQGHFGGTEENRVLPIVKQECYNLNAVVIYQSRYPEDVGGVILQNSVSVCWNRKIVRRTHLFTE